MQSSLEFLSGSGERGLVSVIIPTYNRAHLIVETLNSLLAQTYTRFEAIIVDDGSKDNTRETVARYTDPRIRYFQKQNGGLSSARNFGLDQARGEFIAFLDSDDLWYSWKLAAQMEIFDRHDDVGMIWTDMSTFETLGRVIDERHLRTYYAAYRRIDMEKKFNRRGSLRDLTPDAPPALHDCPYYDANVFDAMFMGNLVHPPTAIVRRSRLRESGRFEPEVTGNGAEDYHFYFKITERGPVAFLDAPAILYRVHANQMSTTGNAAEARADLRLINYWLERRPDALSKRERESRLAGSHGWVGATALYEGNHREATPHLWRSLLLRPRQPMAAALLFVSLLPPGAVPAIRRAKHVIRAWMSPRRVLTLAIGGSGTIYLLYRLASAFFPEFAAES